MESIEQINTHLLDSFGLDTHSSRPMFRVVWSDDQFERRRTKFSAAGIELLVPQVLEVPKYRQYAPHKWILERLVIIPESDQVELPVDKQSYEPLWVFDQYPIFPACKFVIDTMYAALGKRSLKKYIEKEENVTEDGRQERITKLQEELFGNETATTDALAYREGVTVPTNYEKTRNND